MTGQPEKDNRSAFEPTDKIENFLIGFISFLQGFLRALRDLAFAQSRFSRAMLDPQSASPYTKPVTFITLISFFAIRIFRFGVLTVLLALGSASCHAETWTETAYPSLMDELKIPTFTEIILYGIPTLIVVLLLSRFLRFVLLKPPAESGQLLASLTYYAVGFNYMAFLLLFLFISLMIYLQPPDWFAYLILILPPLFLLWVVLAFQRLISRTVDQTHLRVTKRGFKQVWLFLWSLVLILVSTLTAWGMAYSLAQFEVEEREAKPLLTLGLIAQRSFDENVELDLLAKNNSNEEVSLIVGEINVYGKLMHDGRVLDTCSGLAPVVTLIPGETCWLTISFEKEGWQYGFVFVSIENTVQFQAADPSGTGGHISAYVQRGEEPLPISEFEE